jgi:hypothetical protein
MPKEKRVRRGASRRQQAEPEKESGVKTAKKRREQRKEKFLAGLQGTQAKLEKDKEVKQVGKVLADFKPLTEALKEYEAQAKLVDVAEEKSIQQRSRKRGTLKNRQRKKLQMQEVALFQQVLKHPATQNNPCAAIKEHLNNTFQSNAAQDADIDG